VQCSGVRPSGPLGAQIRTSGDGGLLNRIRSGGTLAPRFRKLRSIEDSTRAIGPRSEPPGHQSLTLPSRPLRRLVAAAVLAACAVSARAQTFDTATIPTVSDSWGIAVSDDNRTVYATTDYGAVSILDAVTNRFVSTINTSSYCVHPTGIAFYDGKIYVESFDNIVIIDAATRAVVRILQQPFIIGMALGDVAMSPDGRYAYCVSGSSYELSIVDTSQDEIVDSIPLDRDFSSVTVSPDGSRLYVLNPNTAQMLVFDVATHALLRTADFTNGRAFLNLPVDSVMRSDGHVFVAWSDPNYRAHVSQFDADGRYLYDFTLPGYSTGLALSLDERHLLTGGGWIVDPSTGATIDHFVMPSGLGCVAFAPCGETAYVTNTNGQLVTAVWGFRPSLTISGTPQWGRTITVNLLAPGSAGALYQVAASCSATQGITLGDGRIIPLDRDALFRDSLTNRTTAFTGFLGNLGSDGQATAHVAIGSGIPGKTVGETFNLAFVTFRDGIRSARRVDTISNVVPVTILP
jgi:DNA-binding beta-propeller fold protein YncE